MNPVNASAAVSIGHESLADRAPASYCISFPEPTKGTEMDPATEVLLLTKLFEDGAMTERQLEVAAGDVDQIDAEAIAEWAESVAERGLIELMEGSPVVRRWKITDAGRRHIGNEPGR